MITQQKHKIYQKNWKVRMIFITLCQQSLKTDSKKTIQMFICLCRNIKCSEKRPSLFEPEKTHISLEFAEEIHMKCSGGVGLGCGLCLDSVKELIDEHLSASCKSGTKIKQRARA